MGFPTRRLAFNPAWRNRDVALVVLGCGGTFIDVVAAFVVAMRGPWFGAAPDVSGAALPLAAMWGALALLGIAGLYAELPVAFTSRRSVDQGPYRPAPTCPTAAQPTPSFGRKLLTAYVVLHVLLVAIAVLTLVAIVAAMVWAASSGVAH
ncbi:MAG TPA: hypothetical protein VIF09_22825 [Polyangiaceae bacterium]